MTRARSGATRNRHREVLALTKGQRGTKHRVYKRAHEALLKAWSYAYRHRRERKRDFRRLWIVRINAAARLHDLTYGQLINGLIRAHVEIDRKMLADLALSDPDTFGQLVAVAKESQAA